MKKILSLLLITQLAITPIFALENTVEQLQQQEQIKTWETQEARAEQAINTIAGIGTGSNRGPGIELGGTDPTEQQEPQAQEAQEAQTQAEDQDTQAPQEPTQQDQQPDPDQQPLWKELGLTGTTENKVGTLSIPDVGIEVDIFDTNSQKVVDKKNSAAIFAYSNTCLIADHWNQGFISIKDCKEGTKAFIKTEGNTFEFICTSVTQGHNTGKKLTDNNYTEYESDFNVNGITCYTCNGNWKNVWIVTFTPIVNNQ